jgi:hypothetical protein
MTYPKFWRKAIKGVVGGRTINKRGEYEEFMLKGDPKEVPEDMVTVEIYDEEGEKYFKKTNRTAITNGYLIEVNSNTLVVDEVNAVSDGQLKDLLKLPITQFKKKVELFTSPIPIARLLAFAVEENKPIRIITYLREALSGLDEGSSNVTSVSTDSVKVSTLNK